jgi:hypothetical protein
MRELKSDFIYEFKAGDNIAYNFEILGELYSHKNSLSKDKKILLHKPIIIIIVSIVEAMFRDLYERIRKIPGDFPEIDTNYFHNKDLSDFKKLIGGF